MHQKIKEGGMALNAATLDGFPSIGDVLNSPISNFISFATNYCGYTGTTNYLMINWVHPMFLKSKSAASKEYNLNCVEAMSGPFADDSGTTNHRGTQKPDNPLKGIRNPIPWSPDNNLKGIWYLVQNGTWSQWTRGLTVPT